MGQIKAHFSFWFKITFRKMTGNKQFDLRKIEYSGTAFFKEDLLFLKKKSNAFEIKNQNV